MPRISICIATYKRPEGLAALLQSINVQEFRDDVTVEILIVDNDPPTAEGVVSDFALTSPYDVRYLEQPEPNIALTRNAGVSAATGDFIWFVDDDEVAEPTCLQRLLDAAQDFNADVVYGPVVPSFDGPIAEWLKPLHNRPIHETGTISMARRTGNTLVRASVLDLIDGPFNIAYGLTGGEDSMLFRQLEAKGLTLVDSEDAIVTETVPLDRSSWGWLLARKRRLGQIYGRQTVDLQGSRLGKDVAVVSVKAIVQVVGWAGAALVSRRGRTQRSDYLLRMWTNVGKLEGVIGRQQ